LGADDEPPQASGTTAIARPARTAAQRERLFIRLSELI
jgi:hypothetical protein